MKISFFVLQTMSTCVGGSRSYKTNIKIAERDIKLPHALQYEFFQLIICIFVKELSKINSIFEKKIVLYGV